jgi:ribosomal-protein-alanine N-acetyltransferase
MQIETLTLKDVDRILEIEEAVYAYPWTKGNFIDSFSHEHIFFGLKDHQKLFAYFVLMPILDELHLLTIAVASESQRHGYGLTLLEKLVEFAFQNRFSSILLEVRVSNLRAIKIYKKFGFEKIGYRKNYYPAFNQEREDAIVMRFLVE